MKVIRNSNILTCMTRVYTKYDPQRVNIPNHTHFPGSNSIYTSSWISLTDAKIVCISRVRYDDDTICEYKFTYDLDENQETNFRIENTKCPPTNVAAISIIGVIIATFFLGLLILCLCRLNMWLADRREYRAFEEERMKTTYKYESPLYKSPVTHFKNPNSPEHTPRNVFELK